MARQVYLSSNPEDLLHYMDEMESECSDDDFDGYVDDDEEQSSDEESGKEQEQESEAEEMEEERSMEDTSDMDMGRGGYGDSDATNGDGGGVSGDGDDANGDSMSGESDGANGDENGEGASGGDGASTNDASASDIPVFSETVGVVPDMTGKDPIDYYNLFISDDILDNVLDETNRYGDQYVDTHAEHLRNHSRARAHDFVKRRFTMSELVRFLVLVITMGIVDLPAVGDYWSTSWPFHTSHFSSILSRDRFLLLCKFLHLADNSNYVEKGRPGYDKLFKLRPFLDPLIESFREMFVPNKNLSIDEAMISFKGRLSFLQYMPKKPKKWGMKAWALADANTGYVWNWKLYTGKEGDKREEKLGDRVVTGLLAGLEHKGYHVYCDNYYTNPGLCKHLLTVGFGSCSTVRNDRKGLPKWFQKSKPKKGEIVTYQDGQLLGLKWKDKRNVTMLSTIHDESMVTKLRRTREAIGGREVIEKPAMVEAYNMNMGGVDKSDQLVTYYGFRRCSKKWWKRAFFHLLELAMVNAYVLYCYNTPKKERLSHLKFRLSVASTLLSKTEPTPLVRFHPPAPANVPLRLTGRHFPEPAGGRPDCKVCSDREKGKRKQTMWRCKTCKVAMCVHPCFERYHTLQYYK